MILYTINQYTSFILSILILFWPNISSCCELLALLCEYCSVSWYIVTSIVDQISDKKQPVTGATCLKTFNQRYLMGFFLIYFNQLRLALFCLIYWPSLQTGTHFAMIWITLIIKTWQILFWYSLYNYESLIIKESANIATEMTDNQNNRLFQMYVVMQSPAALQWCAEWLAANGHASWWMNARTHMFNRKIKSKHLKVQ